MVCVCVRGRVIFELHPLGVQGYIPGFALCSDPWWCSYVVLRIQTRVGHVPLQARALNYVLSLQPQCLDLNPVWLRALPIILSATMWPSPRQHVRAPFWAIKASTPYKECGALSILHEDQRKQADTMDQGLQKQHSCQNLVCLIRI